MNNSRGNTILLGALAALLIPWIEKTFGAKLSIDQAIGLIVFVQAAFHGGITAFERYFPPPNPQKPVEPAKVP
jgi:hypothetical protein